MTKVPDSQVIPVTLVSLLEHGAELQPDAPAVLDHDGEWLSYTALHAQANRLAFYLVAAGVAPESRVALALPRSVELLVAVLAVLKSGAAFVPLDPSHPDARLATLLEEAHPVVLLTLGHLTARFAPLSSMPQVELDSPDVCVALAACPEHSLSDADRHMPLSPAHPAYVLYTSGSTGRPKGVIISHRSISRYVTLLCSSVLEPSEATHWPLFTPLGFDLTLTSLFVPLVSGGTLELLPEGPPEEALAFLFGPESRSSALKLTPSHLTLLETLSEAYTDTLRLVIVGGEALLAGHVRTLQARAPQARLLNEYGPTETTIGAVAAVVSDVKNRPIGTPYPGVEALVLDEHLQVCPEGVPGELYLGGECLARGYLERPGLSAGRFVASPYGPAGARLYRTGDRVSRRAVDGQLIFHGRTDEQIKLRGHRMEPGEIESLLTRHPEVSQAAVVIRVGPTGEAGDECLVACIVLDDERTIESAEERALAGRLRVYLAQLLPEVMIPGVFEVMARLPLTANAKLDRGALRRPLAQGHVALRADAVPRVASTPDEQRVCRLVAETLGLSEVSPGDHFFALGGHSLAAARLVAALRRETGRALPLRVLFEHPQLDELARFVRYAPASQEPVDDTCNILLPIRDTGTGVPLFCAHPVIGLCWPYFSLLNHTDVDQPIYGLQSPGHVPGSPLPDCIDTILDAVIAAIDSVTKSGPLHLCGWSFGGVLAHVIATRLQSEGRTVERLILIDAYPPYTAFSGESIPVDPRPDGLWRDLAFGLDINVPDTFLVGTLDGNSLLTLAQAQGLAVGTLSLAQLNHFAEVMAANTRIALDTTLSIFKGDIELVAANQRPAGFDALRMSPAAWQNYCHGNIETNIISSTHNRMLSNESLSQMSLSTKR